MPRWNMPALLYRLIETVIQFLLKPTIGKSMVAPTGNR